MRMLPLKKSGFTLAELLIALAILGVIATFTIPKVLQAQGNQKYNAIAKEAAGTISASYDAYRLKNTPAATTRVDDLTHYMNYARTDTSGAWIDDNMNASPWQCSASEMCLRLHNGAVLGYNPGEAFAGTANTNYVRFWLDPDGGTNNGSSAGLYRSIELVLYYNGRLTSIGVATNDPGADPPWFSW